MDGQLWLQGIVILVDAHTLSRKQRDEDAAQKWSCQQRARCWSTGPLDCWIATEQLPPGAMPHRGHYGSRTLWVSSHPREGESPRYVLGLRPTRVTA